MLKMVNGTGIIGVDMICPLGVSTPQPPNYDRVELEGTGMLVLPNSLDAPLERLELGGKTEQVQTSGKNLFNIKTYRDMNGCEIINNNQLSFVQNLAKINYEIELDAGDYRISFNRKKYSSITIRNGETVLNTNGGEIDYGYTIKLSGPAVISIEFASGQNPNAEQRIIYNIQLEKSSTTTPYEPYTGGKPSPSQEYQQKIKNVGKWNEETKKYEVDVKITGKNLFDVDYFAKNEVYQNKEGEATDWKYATLKVEPNTTYTVSKGKNTKVNGGINNDLNFSGALIFYIDTKSVKITSKDDGVLYIMFYYRNEDVNALKEMDIQVELGDTQTPYQPYKEQTLTLTSDRPITKWDRLVEQGGQIGWLYQSNTVVIDGSETWSSSNVPDHIYFTTTVNNKSGRINTSLCKTYKNNGEPVFNKKHEGEYNIYSDHPTNGVSDTTFVPPNETVTTIPQWKEWLNANPIEMLYKTKTTEFIPLPQSEQNAIRALKTYYPTTVITADGGELGPDIKITYRKEI